MADLALFLAMALFLVDGGNGRYQGAAVLALLAAFALRYAGHD